MEALKEHFKNSKFPCEMDHYLPVVFSPARDGKQLTEPLPIVGQNKQPIPIGLSSPKADEMDGHDTLEDDGNNVRGWDADQNQCDVLMIHMAASSNSDRNGGVGVNSDDDYGDDEDTEK